MIGKFLSAKFRPLAIGFTGLTCLAACTSIPDSINMPNGDYRESVRHIPYAAATPMRDLNIGLKPVPKQLRVLQNPYGRHADQSCANILKETRDLEAAISRNYSLLYGPDYDRRTRAGNLGEASHQVVKAAATSLLPYRGIVRYASGAYHRNKEGLRADRRGRERMGYLVATGRAQNCPGFVTPLARSR